MCHYIKLIKHFSNFVVMVSFFLFDFYKWLSSNPFTINVVFELRREFVEMRKSKLLKLKRMSKNK